MNPFRHNLPGRLVKLAGELEKKPSRAKEVAKIVAQGTLGTGLGTAAGYLVPKGLDAALRASGHPGLPAAGAVRWVPPIAGAGMGLAASLLHAQQAHAAKKMLERES